MSVKKFRPLRPPLRWPGGKRRLANSILPHLSDHQAYVETCCGGAAIFWAKPADASACEVLNDADGELINFYQVLHKRGKRLAAEVDAMPYSRALFNRIHRESPAGGFRRALRFWYLNRVAFGSKRRKPSFGVCASHRPSVLPASILCNLAATIERLRGVSFESLDLVRLLGMYDRPTTLFYVDPPYYGLSQDYVCTFAEADHVRLAEALANLQGHWLLSYNDCPQIRALYRGYPRRRRRLRYTLGCNARTGRNPDRKAVELLLSNRPFKGR